MFLLHLIPFTSRPETYCTKRQREEIGEGVGGREGGQGEGRASTTTTATSDDIRRSKQPSALSLDLFLPPSLSETDFSSDTHFEELS